MLDWRLADDTRNTSVLPNIKLDNGRLHIDKCLME